MDMTIDDFLIKPLERDDNAPMAAIIRASLAEFGVDKPGTVFTDPTTDDLHTLFRTPRSHYMTAWKDGRLFGGAGVFPSAGLPADTCELVKMYLLPDVRGRGLGRKMISLCLERAKDFGFQRVYIETMPELTRAIDVYRRFGFRHLDGPMGDTGHFGCDVWMILDL